jgi:non-homologous end joining protein Ku
MSEHTAGPWKFTYTDESGECFIIAKNLGGMVGAALPWPTEIDARDFRRVIANARLIAAAPELLEALRQMVVNAEADGKEYRDCYKNAVAAIAKAEGRS